MTTTAAASVSERRAAVRTAEVEALTAASLGIPTLATCWPRSDGACAAHEENCYKPGKRPLTSRKAATLDRNRIITRHRRYPEAGLKWLLTPPYVVIDVDAKSGGLETTTRWYIEYGPLPRTWADTNGHDAGGHYVLTMSGGFDGVLLLGRGVEAFGRGSEIVMPPSPYYLGGRRAWRPGCSPDDIGIAEAPTWLVKKIRAAEARGARARTRRRGEPLTPADIATFSELFASIGIDGGVRARGLYRCPFHDDRSPSLSVDWRRGLFKCWAASCDARGSLGTLRRLVSDSPRIGAAA